MLRKGPSTNLMRTLDFYIGIIDLIVAAKSSLFEALDPLGLVIAWSPKLRKIMAKTLQKEPKRPSDYILLGSRC